MFNESGGAQRRSTVTMFISLSAFYALFNNSHQLKLAVDRNALSPKGPFNILKNDTDISVRLLTPEDKKQQQPYERHRVILTEIILSLAHETNMKKKKKGGRKKLLQHTMSSHTTIKASFVHNCNQGARNVP
uniref:Uncharacterized protein n=1 Tax=Glossina austeni TaxID=7395 RepID=A0A1A9VT66_GLOAU